MVLFNYSTRELTAKVVYYGPGICGKTTNLQFIHENLPGSVRGKMLSLATKTDRTLFFDFLPIDLGEIRGMKTRVQLYTVPGQVFYNETRKLVLKGVDGVVFVADSQEAMLGANVESFKNLEENLKAHGIRLSEIPHVIQFNKRDLPKLSAIEDINAALNKFNAPFYESVATTGIGVQDTLKAIVKLVLLNLTRKYESKSVANAAVVAAPPLEVAVMASVASSRVATTAGESLDTPHAMPETTRSHIPLSPIDSQAAPARPSVSPLQDSRKASPPQASAMSPFGEAEIDGLVDEIEEIEAPAPAPAEHADEGTWIGVLPGDGAMAFGDDSATYGSSVPIDELVAEGTRPIADGAGNENPERDVLLSEVASDEDLFSDPSLEIAHLADGQTREIVVPVMLGEGASARRFKLAIRLRLDAVE